MQYFSEDRARAAVLSALDVFVPSGWPTHRIYVDGVAFIYDDHTIVHCIENLIKREVSNVA